MFIYVCILVPSNQTLPDRTFQAAQGLPTALPQPDLFTVKLPGIVRTTWRWQASPDICWGSPSVYWRKKWFGHCWQSWSSLPFVVLRPEVPEVPDFNLIKALAAKMKLYQVISLLKMLLQVRLYTVMILCSCSLCNIYLSKFSYLSHLNNQDKNRHNYLSFQGGKLRLQGEVWTSALVTCSTNGPQVHKVKVRGGA